MPQPCKICRHADRQAIDAALLWGYTALRAIGEQYGVSKDSLSRHYHAHLRNDGADDGQAGEDQGGLSLAIAEKEPEAEARQTAEDSAEKKELVEAWRPLTPEERAAEIIRRYRQNAGQGVEDSTVRNSEEPQDAEGRYRAFIERWRGRFSIPRDEMADWPFEVEELDGLIETARARGDLFRIGRYYLAAAQTLRRFNAEIEARQQPQKT